jgi:hypothetical protein
MARKADVAALEAGRFDAARRFARGESQADVARALGVTPMMRAYLAGQRTWLTVERLPAYAPELNPVEPVWGNAKTRELANHCAPDLDTLGRPSPAVLARADELIE